MSNKLKFLSSEIKPNFSRQLVYLIDKADEIPTRYRDKIDGLTIAKDYLTGKPEKPVDAPNVEDIDLVDDRHQLCYVPIRQCWGDAVFNRANEINFPQISKNLEKSQGYSFSTSGAIDVVYDPEHNKFIVSKGQHRIIMLYYTHDANARILAFAKKINESYSEIANVKANAHDHAADATQYAPQKLHQKTCSLLVAEDPEVSRMVASTIECGVGVQGVMHHYPDLKGRIKRNIDSVFAVKEAEKICKASTYDAIKLLDEYLPPKAQITGKMIIGLTQYLKMFRDKIEKTAKKNKISFEKFIDNVLDYMWNKRRYGVNKWMEGTSSLRHNIVYLLVAKLVKFTNEYVTFERLLLADDRKNDGNDWMSTDEKIWTTYLEKVDNVQRQQINYIING